MVASNGLDITVLSQTAFESMRHAKAALEADWTSVSQQEREAWEHVAGQGLLLLDGERDEISAKELAESLFEAYRRGMGLDHVYFREIPMREQVCWEAVGRHLFNVIDSDGSITLGEIEPVWRAWADKKLEDQRRIA